MHGLGHLVSAQLVLVSESLCYPRAKVPLRFFKSVFNARAIRLLPADITI